MRPSRDDLFVNIAASVALRGTCPRAQVGAIIVVENHIVSMGYNGSPPGQPHCDVVGCNPGVKPGELPYEGGDRWDKLLSERGCQRATHAELNAVAFAARRGIPCVDGTMYVTHATCVNCARAVVAAGIRKVVYATPYRLTEGVELLDKCNVEVTQYGGS